MVPIQGQRSFQSRLSPLDEDEKEVVRGKLSPVDAPRSVAAAVVDIAHDSYSPEPSHYPVVHLSQYPIRADDAGADVDSVEVDVGVEYC